MNQSDPSSKTSQVRDLIPINPHLLAAGHGIKHWNGKFDNFNFDVDYDVPKDISIELPTVLDLIERTETIFDGTKCVSEAYFTSTYSVHIVLGFDKECLKHFIDYSGLRRLNSSMIQFIYHVLPPIVINDTSHYVDVHRADPIFGLRRRPGDFRGYAKNNKIAFISTVYEKEDSVLISPSLLNAIGYKDIINDKPKAKKKKDLVDAVSNKIREEISHDFCDRGEWINFSCILPDHQDAHFSAGLNVRTGIYHCFVCGAFTSQELIQKLGWTDLDSQILDTESGDLSVDVVSNRYYRGEDGFIYRAGGMCMTNQKDVRFYRLKRGWESDDYVVIRNSMGKIHKTLELNSLYKKTFARATAMRASNQVALLSFMNSIELKPPPVIDQHDVDGFFYFIQDEIKNHEIAVQDSINHTLMFSQNQEHTEVLEEVLGHHVKIRFGEGNIDELNRLFCEVLSIKFEKSVNLIKGWAGFQGVEHLQSFPILLLQHTRTSRGKTSVAEKLIHFFGLFEGANVTSSSTLAGIEELVTQLENLPFLIDNFDFEIMEKTALRIIEEAYAHGIRKKYNRSFKEKWRANLVVTTNNLPYDRYGWMKSRCVVIGKYFAVPDDMWNQFLSADFSILGKTILLTPELTLGECKTLYKSLNNHLSVYKFSMEDRTLDTLRVLSYGLKRYNRAFGVEIDDDECVEAIIQAYFDEEESMPEDQSYELKLANEILEVMETESVEIETIDDEANRGAEPGRKTSAFFHARAEEDGVFYFKINAMVGALKKRGNKGIRRRDIVNSLTQIASKDEEFKITPNSRVGAYYKLSQRWLQND